MRGVMVFLMFLAVISSVSAEMDLLERYESSTKDFKEITIGNKIVFFKERKIEEALVEKDFIVYQFDKHSKELLAKKIKWRDDLPKKLPKIITKEQAESLVEGNIQYSTLYYISLKSDVFPVKTKNPCWVVRSIKDGIRIVTIIDAVKGNIIGYGIPSPNGFSLAGADWQTATKCKTQYAPYAENAKAWFDLMGYYTEMIENPIDLQVKSHIQSPETALLYEMAHGSSSFFHNTCPDNESITAYEVKTWIKEYNKIPFTFIASCDGMCNITENYLSYEFRKGLKKGAVTVGYCGMSLEECEADCWLYALEWQDALFSYMNQGFTIKDAFDQANADYPDCVDDSYYCIRLEGDENLKFIPKIKREPDCGDAVRSNTWLSHDLSCSGTGLVIAEDNITLDCQGHTIEGSNSGIGIQNIHNHITIKNCTIKDFDFGIYMHFFADNNNLLYNNITSNDIIGIYFDEYSNSNNLTSNSICFNGIDIHDNDANFGTENICDSSLRYNDAGSEGCRYACIYLEYAIDLYQGWNLISIPLELDNKSIEYALSSIQGNYTDVISYGDGKYKVLTTTSPINETVGFWINMLVNTTLLVTGKNSTNNPSLTKGWNLIGYPYLEEKNLSQLFQNATVFSFNGTWSSYIPNRKINSLEKLKPGYGYFVNIK